MIEYKHKINGLAQQGGIMPPLSHPHKGLPWAPPQSALQDDCSPHPVRLASEAARRSQSPYNRGDTVAIWTLTGLVLAACGGGGGGGGSSGPPPVTFGFDAGAAATAQTFGEDQSAREFSISAAAQGASGPATYSLSGPDADQFNINDDGTVRFAATDDVDLDQDGANPKSTYVFTVTASGDAVPRDRPCQAKVNITGVKDLPQLVFNHRNMVKRVR